MGLDLVFSLWARGPPLRLKLQLLKSTFLMFTGFDVFYVCAIMAACLLQLWLYVSFIKETNKKPTKNAPVTDLQPGCSSSLPYSAWQTNSHIHKGYFFQDWWERAECRDLPRFSCGCKTLLLAEKSELECYCNASFFERKIQIFTVGGAVHRQEQTHQ